MSTSHVILLGDSVFDNAAYVSGRPAVIDQVRSRLPAGWRATLAARDGSVIADVHRQLERLPQDASHLVLSAGGNDLLHEIGILQEPAATVGMGLRLLAGVRDRFREDYRGLLRAAAGRSGNTLVCTVYNPASPDESFQRETVAALGLFNDAIIGIAREFGMPVIDLRAVCTKAADFVNAIEPSSAGGAKIAQAVCDLVMRHDFSTRRTVLVP
jgi:hypothetical protein